VSKDIQKFSNFIFFNQTHNLTHWQKSFERSAADLIPLLPLGSQNTVLIDYAVKIFGVVFSFGLLVIALRRKFERKFRH
jgi:hypothetical protein